MAESFLSSEPGSTGVVFLDGFPAWGFVWGSRVWWAMCRQQKLEGMVSNWIGGSKIGDRLQESLRISTGGFGKWLEYPQKNGFVWMFQIYPNFVWLNLMFQIHVCSHSPLLQCLLIFLALTQIATIHSSTYQIRLGITTYNIAHFLPTLNQIQCMNSTFNSTPNWMVCTV